MIKRNDFNFSLVNVIYLCINIPSWSCCPLNRVKLLTIRLENKIINSLNWCRHFVSYMSNTRTLSANTSFCWVKCWLTYFEYFWWGHFLINKLCMNCPCTRLQQRKRNGFDWSANDVLSSILPINLEDVRVCFASCCILLFSNTLLIRPRRRSG